MIDVHAHALPFVDDGSNSVNNSIEILSKSASLGVTDVVLTPHHRGEYICEGQELKQKFEEFKKVVSGAGISLNLYLGQEIHYTASTRKLLKEGKLLTINDSKYLLIEFPFLDEIDYSEVVYELVSDGYIPIIAHPERYAFFDLFSAYDVKNQGALIQINASSIVGENKKRFYKKVKAMLKRGLVDFVASDIHMFRENELNRAYLKIRKKFGKEVAEKLFTLNAEKIIKG